VVYQFVCSVVGEFSVKVQMKTNTNFCHIRGGVQERRDMSELNNILIQDKLMIQYNIYSCYHII
jgi:hypothetical protein